METKKDYTKTDYTDFRETKLFFINENPLEFFSKEQLNVISKTMADCCKIAIKQEKDLDNKTLILPSELLKINEELKKANEQMFSHMQYYMEYCKSNEYVTPQDWFNNHKHY